MSTNIPTGRFAKGHPPTKGFAGRHHSDESKSKISIGVRRAFASGVLDKRNNYRSPESNIRRSQTLKAYWAGRERISWKKGLTAQTDKRVRNNGLAVSKSLLSNPLERERRSQLMRSYNLTRKDYSEPWNRGMHPWDWQGMSKDEYLTMMAEAQARKPTRLELRVMAVIEEYNLPFRYVGDGQVWIAGKCPDFINTNNEKQLIEVLGDYWHTEEEVAERVEHFARFGFETILIWEREIKDKPDQVILEKLEYNPEVQNAIQCGTIQSQPGN